MAGTGTIKEYLKQICTDILPKSEIENYGYNRIGQYSIKDKDVKRLVSEEIDISKIYDHEKSYPDRYGIKSKSNPDKFYPVYMKYYSGQIRSALGKTIANSALNIFPTPLQSYGISHEKGSSNAIGVATIDLNHLQNIETDENIQSIRLDILLHSLGLNPEIDSFYQFQEMIKSGKLNDKLTARAIVQLGLSKIFIPNAIGETDPNSRNIILLKNASEDKYDIVVRIDADKNKYLLENEDSSFLPTGILTPFENFQDYLRIIRSRDVLIDWELFAGFNTIARELCSRTNIDAAITRSYKSNSFNFDPSIYLTESPFISSYDSSAFYDFSQFAIDTASNYFTNVFDALGYIKSVIPFAESSRAYGNIKVQDTSYDGLKQRSFSEDGREL